MNESVGIPFELVVPADQCAKKIQRAPLDREYFVDQETSFTNWETSKAHAGSYISVCKARMKKCTVFCCDWLPEVHIPPRSSITKLPCLWLIG